MDAVLLVTGASRGIGAAIALAGARAGYRVCINYNRSRSPAEALAARIGDDGGRAITVQADVGDSTAVERCSARSTRSWSAHCAGKHAGGYAGVNRVDEMRPEQLIETFATNIFS